MLGNTWIRAKVMRVMYDQTCVVSFLDTYKFAIVPLDSCRPLDEFDALVPPFALKCREVAVDAIRAGYDEEDERKVLDLVGMEVLGKKLGYTLNIDVHQFFGKSELNTEEEEYADVVVSFPNGEFYSRSVKEKLCD